MAAHREGEKRNHSFKDFGGINTQAARESIDDNEFAWLENVMPIGFGNMPAIYGPTDTGVTGITNCYMIKSANLNNVDYMFMFCSDGSCYQINLQTYAKTTVGAAGTFNGSGTQFDQWKNERILIIDPTKGYFSWDGATLSKYTNTVFSVTVTNSGQGFTGVPSVLFGGPGSSAAATPIIGMVAATATAVGTGYYVGDILNVNGGTQTVQAQLKVTSTGTNGAITGISLLTQGNYTATPGTTLTSAIFANNFGMPLSGSGYTAADVITLSGGTFTTSAQITVDTVDGSGAILTFHISRAGAYTVLPGNPISVTGGTGTGAQFVGSWGTTVSGGLGSGATFSFKWGIASINVTAGGSGYTSAPAVSFSGGGGVGATATANVVAAPSVGTAISVYAGRVWIGNGRTVGFSAPDSYTDFTSVSYGGSFIIEDATLHSSIQSMLAANGFMYIIGEDSVNVVSDVRVGTNPAVTLFSNLNLVTTAGTRAPLSVVPYYRTVWMATNYGFYGVTGATAQKGSDKLDGIYPLIQSMTAISGGVVVINNILCLAFMFNYVDPVLGARTVFAVFFNKKWFIVSQGVTLVSCASCSVTGTPTLFATDGSKLYKLFSNSAATISQKIQTKLWDFGDPLRTKQALKFGLEAVFPSLTNTISINIDNEQSSQQYAVPEANIVNWVNNANAIVQWQNNALQAVQWVTTGYFFAMTDVSAFGKYLGATITSSSPQTTFQGMHMQYEDRAMW